MKTLLHSVKLLNLGTISQKINIYIAQIPCEYDQMCNLVGVVQ